MEVEPSLRGDIVPPTVRRSDVAMKRGLNLLADMLTATNIEYAREGLPVKLIPSLARSFALVKDHEKRNTVRLTGLS